MPNPSSPAAVYYTKGTGESMVYGGAFIGLLTAFIALQSGAPILLIITAIGALVALYHWPMLDKRPALAFDENGLYVQGIGVVTWDLVANVQRVDKPVRTLLNPHLILTLNDNWQAATLAAPLAHAPNTLGRLLRPAGRISGNALSIPLEGLRADADALTQAIEQYWRTA